jgi:hypothetical protein
VDAVKDELTKRGEILGSCSKHLPDKEFLLTVLSSVNPDHKIFGKDFVAPPRNSDPKKHNGSLKNFTSLFGGLPAPSKHIKPNRRT